MTLFSPEPLSANAAARLSQLQTDVDAQTSREAQYTQAKNLWNNRKNGRADKAIWTEVEDKLSANHPIRGICHYCERDRTAATEHFFPKKHFPHRAFQWDNYLLVCYRCNSTYKGDKFAVFTPQGSAIKCDLPVSRNTYPAPPTEDAVLINPRTDNPQDFLTIDLMTGNFVANPATDARGSAKAQYTCDLLHLNTDDSLLRDRKKACGQYLQKLKEYVGAKQATDFPALLAALSPGRSMTIIQAAPFAQEQQRQLDEIIRDMADDLFPVVWLEIKAQRAFYPHINALFVAAPEALAW